MTKLKGAVASVAPMAGVALVGAIMAGQAKAANECGVTTNSGGSITCTTANYAGPGNDIVYDVVGLVLNLNDAGLYVTTSGTAVTVDGSLTSGAANSGTSFDVVVNAMNFDAISTTSNSAHGILSTIANVSSTGSAIVTMDGGDINTAGRGARGIFARTYGLGRALATLNAGTIATQDDHSHGVRSFVRNVNSNAIASAEMNGGVVTTGGHDSRGLFASNDGLGDAAVALRGAAPLDRISTSGDNAHGIQAEVSNSASVGSAFALMSGGQIITSGDDAVGMYALNRGGAGSTMATLSGSASIIGTSGRFAHGVLADVENPRSIGDAVATMSGGRIDTTGRGARGIFARNSGLGIARATMDDGLVTTTGFGAHGALAYIKNAASTDVALVTMNAGSITTDGDSARGLFARNEGLGSSAVVLNGSNSDIVTVGSGAYGIQAEVIGGSSNGQAHAEMNDASIHTSGIDASGVFALNRGDGDAVVAVTGGDITTGGATAGDGAHGAFAQTEGAGSGMVLLSQARITTDGRFAHGAIADVADSASTGDATVTMTGGSIATDGHASRGLFARNFGEGGAAVVLSGGAGTTISTAGDYSYGLFSFIRNTQSSEVVTVTMNGGVVRALGFGADGIRAETVGSGVYDVDVSGGTITSGTGGSAGIHAIASAGGTIDIASGATIDGSASGVAIRDGDADQDGQDEIGGNATITTAGIVTGDALLGDGDDSFHLTGGTFTGDIQGDDAFTAGNDNLEWTGGTLNGGFYGGDGSDVVVVSGGANYNSSVVLDGGDDLDVTTDGWSDTLTFNNLTAAVTGGNILNWETVAVDGGVLSFTDNALRVGSGGMTILGGGAIDVSANFTLTGDLTISNGRFIGSGPQTGVYAFSGSVVNDGAFDLQNGISGDQVTIAGGYSGVGAMLVDLDTSSDSSDRFIINGAYSGSTAIAVNSLSGNATGNDITLVTLGSGASLSNFTLSSGALSVGAFDYTLANAGNDIVLRGAFNSTGATYEVAPMVLSGFNQMSSLQQRIGQRQWTPGGDELSGAWLRIAGDRSDSGTARGSYVEQNRYAVQAGLDYALDHGETGQWVLGATLYHGKVSGDVTASLGTGSIDAEGFGFGATATWYGLDGTYVDIQGQLNSVSADYASSAQGLRAEGVNARTYAMSVEAGKRIALDENRTLVPQAQLTWGVVDGGAFTDDLGTSVDLGGNESLIGRVGLAYEFSDSSEVSGSAAKYYVIGNLLHDFSAGNNVSVGGVDFSSETASTWAEVGMGLSLSLNEGTKVYGETSYRRETNGVGRGLGLSAGLNFQW